MERAEGPGPMPSAALLDDVGVHTDSWSAPPPVPRDVRFVDVFGAAPFAGNALAVVHDADDLADEELAAVARWTNLSETAFLCAPLDPRADYRVRI
ncbi:MAG: PhzF family phenazine biosynthesis protein, partial [Phycicoccus sp.]